MSDTATCIRLLLTNTAYMGAIFSASTSTICVVLTALVLIVSVVLAASSLCDKSHATSSVSVCVSVLSATLSVLGEVMSTSCIWIASEAGSSIGASESSPVGTIKIRRV